MGDSAMDNLPTGEPQHAGSMRLSDNWWERLAILARVAPVLFVLVSFFMPQLNGYYWE